MISILVQTLVVVFLVMSLMGMSHDNLEEFQAQADDESLIVSDELRAYPTDPTSDIPWSGGTSGVADVQSSFNNGRTVENTQLGTSLPMLTFPSQATWDTMSIGEKCLWIINNERLDRSIDAMTGIETNVTGVAQYYAQYLRDNDVFSHNADGRSPWERLEDNPTIGACYDSLSVAENLFYVVTSGSSIPLHIERALYTWLYNDSTSSWGHRHCVLWYPYNDNSGTTGVEGFLGIGNAGGPYLGWNYGEVVVMNVFDPCSIWSSGYDLIVTKTGSGAGTVTSDVAGIDCGLTCSSTFESGTTVVLTAATHLGSLFSGWSGDCSGTGTCDLYMDQAFEVTAVFDENPTYSLLIELEKDSDNLSLSWEAVNGADWYHIYQGSLGNWYDHTSFTASGDISGSDSCYEIDTSVSFTPPAGDAYFLVVPGDDLAEGPYGHDSTEEARPAATPACQ
ncbi:hypothetical protein JXQ70_07000 [bacterium]|nr:hypothetical protein [bacterium]